MTVEAWVRAFGLCPEGHRAPSVNLLTWGGTWSGVLLGNHVPAAAAEKGDGAGSRPHRWGRTGGRLSRWLCGGGQRTWSGRGLGVPLARQGSGGKEAQGGPQPSGPEPRAAAECEPGPGPSGPGWRSTRVRCSRLQVRQTGGPTEEAGGRGHREGRENCLKWGYFRGLWVWGQAGAGEEEMKKP